MATTTFSAACPLGEWTLLADGGSVTSGGFQAAGVQPCRIAVASSAPDPDTADFLLIYPDAINEPLLEITLGSGSNVYGQGLAADAVVRGYLTAA